MLGLARIVFQIPVIYFILPLYWSAVILTYFSTEPILHVAWDASAVTTGPVTVPLILGIGIATATEVRASEGFGVLALASLCPILTTLICGIIIHIPFIEKLVYTGEIEDPEAEKEMDKLLDEDDNPLGASATSYGTLSETTISLGEPAAMSPETETKRTQKFEYSKYKGVGELYVL